MNQFVYMEEINEEKDPESLSFKLIETQNQEILQKNRKREIIQLA